MSGETQLVDDVATTANSATIAELNAADPRLVRWLDENGLTVEEAGRVQPSYASLPPASCLCSGPRESFWAALCRADHAVRIDVAVEAMQLSWSECRDALAREDRALARSCESHGACAAGRGESRSPWLGVLGVLALVFARRRRRQRVGSRASARLAAAGLFVMSLAGCAAPSASEGERDAGADLSTCAHPDYYFRNCCEDERVCERVAEHGTDWVVLSLEEICPEGDCIPTLSEALASDRCVRHDASEAATWVEVLNMGDATSEYSGGWTRTLFYDNTSGALLGVTATQWESIPGYQLGGCCGPSYRAGNPGESALWTSASVSCGSR